MNSQSMLKAIDLSYSYDGSTRALDGLNFELQAGRFHALLGPNGAGKSTLFALLTRLFDAREGRIEVFGKPLRLQPQQALAVMGIVFQQSTLDLDLTVEQNLFYHGALHGLSRSLLRVRISQELEAFDLLWRRRDKVRHLNGGHRRRLELARALLHRPRLLLLDEPTVGLDIATRAYLNQRVRELCGERGVSVLWATHLIEEVLPEDQVILLHRGKVLADCTSEALCSQSGQDSLQSAFGQLTEQAA